MASHGVAVERLNNIVEFTKEKVGRWSILSVSLTVDKPFGNSIVLVGCTVVVFWTRMTNDSTRGNQTINHGPIFAVRMPKSGSETFLIELVGWKNAQSPIIVFNLLFVDDISVYMYQSRLFGFILMLSCITTKRHKES